MLSVLRAAGRRRCTARSRCKLNLKVIPQNSLRLAFQQRRHLVEIPTILLPPVVFGGLLITLWTWKCCMMIIFQNKIIFMPGLPPYARRETIEDYRSQCGGVEWEKHRTTAIDGKKISLCVASVETGPKPVRSVYILYFQGNASSLPPRLPFLSPALRMLRKSPIPSEESIRYKMVCCSYRGYWTSRGRPSEKGIAKDAQAALKWIRDDNAKYETAVGRQKKTSIVVWGQSIGAGFATRLAAEASVQRDSPTIDTLILETPFLSIRSMLETLYPQKWLPYRYLWPFLRNHLDTPKALSEFEKSRIKTTAVLILDAGKDELVPSSHGDDLDRICRELGFHVTRRTVGGALHTEVMTRHEGIKSVVEAIRRSGQSQSTG